MDSKFVMPGDEVAIEEEYAAGEGTFAQDGTVYAAQVGTLVLDDDSCTASIACPNPPNILHKGDIVYAVVADIRKTMATADVIAKAHGAVDSERHKAMIELSGSVVDLSVEIATKIIGNDLTEDQQRKLAEKYLAEVSAPNGD